VWEFLLLLDKSLLRVLRVAPLLLVLQADSIPANQTI
jgi:hypothetical protein